MLRSLKDWLATLAPASAEAAPDAAHRLHLAAAVLLVEVMRSDRDLAESERRAALAALQRRFGLTPDEQSALLEQAETAARDAHDFHSFTSRLNEAFEFDDKVRMVEQLWEVAYADGVLSAHEHHVIRKIAELLHVPQGAYINAKLRAKQAAGIAD